MTWWDRVLGKETPEIKAALEVTPEVVQSLTSSWPWGSYGAMYRLQPAVRTVVDFLARNIAQLNLKAYERRDNADRVERDEHPVAMLLRNPNVVTTRFRHMRDTVADIAVYDRAYWVKQRVRGQTRGIVRMAPPLITPVVDQNTGVTVYEGPNRRRYARDELVIFSGYNPDGDGLGVPPLETLRRVLAEEWASVGNRERFWRNSARQSGWVERPQDAPQLSQEAFQRVLERLNMMVSGENAGRVGLLEEGMTWNGQAFSPKDSEYVEGRMLTLAEVCRLYGGGALMAMIGAGSDTKASVEARHREGYQDIFGPWLRFIQDEIELQLLPEMDTRPLISRRIYIEFNLADKLKGCVPAGTIVETPDGPRNIEDIKPRDHVWSVVEDNRLEPRMVWMAGQTGVRSLLEIKTQGRTLRATDNHPIRLVDGSYKPAGDLKRGDVLLVLQELPGDVAANAEIIGSWDERYLARWEALRPFRTHRRQVPTGTNLNDVPQGCTGMSVVSVEAVRGQDVPVFNLTIMDEGRNYIANGVVVHNSFEQQSDSLTRAVGVPYMTTNEGRARLNLPRIDEDWADTPVQPLNVMYGGQPAVNVPVTDEATA